MKFLLTFFLLLSISFASAEEPPHPREKLGVECWKELSNIEREYPDPRQKSATRDILLWLAGKIKTGQDVFNVDISQVDIRKAVELLNSTAHIACDKLYGDSNKECSPQEWERFTKSNQLQLRVIEEMARLSGVSTGN